LKSKEQQLMDMREYEYNLRHRADDLRREMEHQRLVESIMQERPSMFGRLWSLVGRAAQPQGINAAVPSVPSPKAHVKTTLVAAANTNAPCQPECA
jgi:hypothetical protein